MTASPLDYDFWARYLDVFDEVGVLARVHETPPGSSAREVAGPGVRVVEVPAYVGPGGFVASLPGLRRAVGAAAEEWDAVIVRAPSALGTLLFRRLARGRPFGLEVIGDPGAVFARGAVRHPLRVFFRWWFADQLRQQCRAAAAVSYVSRSLERRYPPRGEPDPAFVSVCPWNELPASALVDCPRRPESFQAPFRLVTVGSLEQPYKGVDVLIRAVAAARGRGLEVSLDVVGGGREQERLESLARSLAQADHVTFAGHVPAPQVVSRLDAADVFALASRTEGLPHVIVEAMARALPCVASDVGGIPELLDAADLFPPGNPSALAEKLADVMGEPEELAAMSARNLEAARGHTSEVLRPKRHAFLEAVRAASLGKPDA